jgi:hypothetical protein
VGGRPRERDLATGRPIGSAGELIEGLTDGELTEELLIAASAPDHRRINRFNALLAERERRRAACAGV